MTPNKKYEVLQAFDLEGAIREVGTVIELPEADALQYVDSGLIKEVQEGGSEDGNTPAPTAPVTPEGGEGSQATPAPETPVTPEMAESGRGNVPNPDAEPAAPVAAKAGDEWAGNHVVGGNENAPLRVPHPDLAKG